MFSIKNNKLIYPICFLFWFSFSMISEGFDWDFTYTMLEIDIRSFLENGFFSDWSYQFCGGITRSGDPNSYAESIWFLIPFIFGSFIGAKLIVPVGMTLVTYFLNDFLKNYLKIENSSLYLVLINLNSFCILHFTHGHTAYFSQILFATCSIYIYLFLKTGLKKDLIKGITLFYLSFSIGMYQVSAFMGLPITISYMIALLLFLIFERKLLLNIKRLGLVLVGIIGVFAINFHKIQNVIDHQKNFPRITNISLESYGFLEIIHSLFFPTLGERRDLLPLNNLMWGIQEYAFFSILNWVGTAIIILLIFDRFKKGPTKAASTTHKFNVLFLAILIIFSTLLYFGSFSEYAPYALINKYLFNNSQRVSSRYLLWAVLSLNLIAIYGLEKKNYFFKHKKKILLFGLLISLFQVVNVLDSSGRFDLAKQSFLEYINSPSEYNQKMQYVSMPLTSSYFSLTFLTRKNYATIKCYTPLSYDNIINHKLLNSKTRKPYYFLSKKGGEEINPNSACYNESYFTQQRIVISNECPDELEIRLANINPKSPIKNYNYKKDYENNVISLIKKVSNE